ncbi:SurA N-terminal domain-containing protein, partial [Methylobacter sp.]|uniref:SurA N-terminal domain-containing protein n=1 Tax=Methylobacter sp. TaxID=2051955 RepID=UPI003DA641C5
MLQKLNERIQGVVAWLVIILIAITFTIFGVDYYLQSHQTNNVKVLVNDTPITNQAFEANYRRTRSHIDISQMTSQDEKKLQSNVLEQMIANEVTVQSAHKVGFDVSSNQANSAILAIPQFQEDGHFSPQRYQQALSAAMFTPETFQNEVKQGMLLNQQRFAFIGSSFALPAEVKRFVRLYMQTRDYDYLTVSASQFETQAKISETEIKDYYTKHQATFMTPEQVSINYLQLSMHDIRNSIKVTNEEIKHFYEENKNSYLTPAQWQVSHILFAIPVGASPEQVETIQKKADAAYEQLKANPSQFDQMVATMSDDKLSIADKGVLPWISATQADYAKALADVTKPGQLSSPQRTKHGFELFKLIDYKPAQTKTLAELEMTIKNQLVAEQA